jgi:hypothetical protein
MTVFNFGTSGNSNCSKFLEYLGKESDQRQRHAVLMLSLGYPFVFISALVGVLRPLWF